MRSLQRFFTKDTIVRVYIYNLRKKLDHYYSHEGKEDSVRIDIPKGHYDITFFQHDKPRKKIKKVKHLNSIVFAILIVSNIFFITRYIDDHYFRSVDSDIRENPIWGSFLTNGNTKQIVLGDHFFFIKDSHIREKRTIMRRDNINTLQEFETFKSQSSARSNYVRLRYPMFPRNSVWPITDLITVFNEARQNFKLNYASNVTATDFKNDDLIFIGSFHTLSSFEQTFHNSRFGFQVYPNKLWYFDESKDSLITKGEQGDPVYNHIDYGIVRKIPGPNGKIIFTFTSFHETGTVGIVKYFTDPEALNELCTLFTAKFGHIPQYYEILFQASGYNRTVFTTEIEYVAEIGPNTKFW
jgi:hypothetical protein